MRDTISGFLRSGIGTLLWSVGVLIAIGTHLWLLFANYSGLVQAFELLGSDQKPLGDDPLFGWIFEALLLGDANQGHLFAGILVVALAAGFWLVCFYAFRLISLAGSRVRFKNQGDTESAREAEIRMKYDSLPYFLITLIPLIAAAWWDIRLFNFRSLAGGYGIEAPDEALMLKDLSATMTEAPDSFLHALNCIGGWGYLAATFLTALFLKFTWTQLKESAIILEGSFLDLMNIGVEKQSQGDSATTATTPGMKTEQAGTDNLTTENIAAESETERQTVEELILQPEAEIVNTSQEARQAPVQSHTTDQSLAEIDELVTVVGEDRQVRLSELNATLERYFKHEDGRWWNRQYYDSLHTKENNEKEVA